MRVIYNVKHCYVIHLKYGDKSLSFLTKLVVKAKASICSTIKANPHLFCHMLLLS